jgi:phosphoglycolate phosphatase
VNKAIIFDFDGTLVDSEKSLYECFQSVTKVIAPERESFAKKILIGPPLRVTVSKILGSNYQDQIDKFVNLFIEIHDEKAIKYTQPYPDVSKVLQTLNKENVSMAIATNKRQAPTIKLINYFGWKKYFKFVECIDSESQIRNKDGMIKEILEHDESLYGGFFIGDTVNDGLSANLNKLKFIRANYGFGLNQDWTKINIHKEICKFSEVLDLF